jgi:oligosaccharide repeat unit polymerase
VSRVASYLGGPRVIRLDSIFSPLTLVVFLYTPLLALYVLSSPAVFALDFDSRKTLSWTGLAFFALSILLFAAGAKAGGGRRSVAHAGGPPEPIETDALPRATRRSLAVLLEAALLLSVGAYLLWFGLGVVRAGGIGNFLEIWRTDPHLVKKVILVTLPGVTTLTQLAVAAIPLAIAYGFVRRGSVIRMLVVLIAILAVLRTIFFSERLAFIELAVPIAFLLLAPRRVTVPRVVLYVVSFVLAAMVFFSITELRRTYVYTHNFSPDRSATRFFGYYLTSVNNGMAVIDHYPASTPFASTGEFLWRFPGLRDLRVDDFAGAGTVTLRYPDLFGVEPDSFWPQAFSDQGLSYEFNVFTAPGFLAADFGWAALLVVLLLGYVSGRLYRRTPSSPFHRALYAVWLVGMFEFMRILYFTSTRVFPAYLLFAAVYLVLRQGVPLTARIRLRAGVAPPPAGSRSP